MRIQYQVALVTGAGRGVGQAIALRLAEEGAFVAVNDLDAHAAVQTATLIEDGLSKAALAVVADVSNADEVRRMILNVIERFGKIDILVNYSGLTRDDFIQDMAEEDWDLVLDANLRSVYLCCKAVIPFMKERFGGKIVNVTSRAYTGSPRQANYAAAHAGIVAFTRSLALELAQDGINVNAVAAGLIETAHLDSLPAKTKQKLLDEQPTLAAGLPRDVANAVLFLASDEADYITGEVLHVDGGRSIGSHTI